MKTTIKLLLAVLGIAMMTSCSEVEPSTRTTFYKVTLLEKNVAMIVGSTEPRELTLPGYETGDTIWVNTKTKRIDPTDSLGMLAVVEGCPETLPFVKSVPDN